MRWRDVGQPRAAGARRPASTSRPSASTGTGTTRAPAATSRRRARRCNPGSSSQAMSPGSSSTRAEDVEAGLRAGHDQHLPGEAAQAARALDVVGDRRPQGLARAVIEVLGADRPQRPQRQRRPQAHGEAIDGWRAHPERPRRTGQPNGGLWRVGELHTRIDSVGCGPRTEAAGCMRRARCKRCSARRPRGCGPNPPSGRQGTPTRRPTASRLWIPSIAATTTIRCGCAGLARQLAAQQRQRPGEARRARRDAGHQSPVDLPDL